MVPIAIVYAVLTSGAGQTAVRESGEVVRVSSGGITSGLFFATLLMILFRRRYPLWWFEFARELTRFGARVTAYVTLLRDEYPSTVEEQGVHLEIDYPDVERDLNRWLPLVGRWWLRVDAYAFLLVTDRYPPFSLKR